MRKDTAFTYRCDLTLAQQLERLNARGPLQWVERDSHWYGDYLTTKAHPDYAYFKIFDDAKNGRFVLNLKFVADPDRPSFEDELRELVALARERVLPALDARDVEETEPYD